jgi:DNA-binding IclR family transcriptional regulator
VTDNAQLVLDYIEGFLDVHGYAPSLREISRDLDLGLATVHKWVVWLEREGYIVRKPHSARTILVLQ